MPVFRKSIVRLKVDMNQKDTSENGTRERRHDKSPNKQNPTAETSTQGKVADNCRRYDTHHNDTQQNDTQQNDTQDNDTQDNDAQDNDTHHNDTQYNLFICDTQDK